MAGHAPTPADIRIAQRVRTARESAGLSRREIGAVLGVSGAQFAKYESGRNRISAGALQLVAETLYLPVGSFFDAPGQADADAPALPFESH